MKILAVYEGDTLLVVGTIEECAEYLGITKNNLYSKICKYKRGMTKKRQYVEVDMDVES